MQIVPTETRKENIRWLLSQLNLESECAKIVIPQQYDRQFLLVGLSQSGGTFDAFITVPNNAIISE